MIDLKAIRYNYSNNGRQSFENFDRYKFGGQIYLLKDPVFQKTLYQNKYIHFQTAQIKQAELKH